ncbi:MAG: hypothetical protein DCE86_16760 [Flavobacteriaceae bacterium]|nr:MAG: hypothetical protein DCE86_16760 [Flavobacteriaceae bacterium]
MNFAETVYQKVSMKSVALLFIVFFTAQMYAQVDYNKSISIPSANTNSTMSIPSTESNTTVDPNFGFTIPKSLPKSDKYKVGGTDTVNFGQGSEQFANPGDKYTKELNKKSGGESQVAVKGNQYFGDFKNNGEYVNIVFRDHGAPDGDMIKISVNDVVVVPSVTLTTDFRTLKLPLKPGFNRVDFEALNQGTSGPNTAEFHVFDDKGNLVVANRWNLATGFKATAIIVKE